MRIWILIITGSLMVFFYSCGKQSTCGKKTGVLKTILRDLQPFSKLILKDNIDVILMPSSINRASITGGENLIDFITTDVSNNELTISNTNRCNFLRSYKKRITVLLEYTLMDRIYYLGSGNIWSNDTIKQAYFEAECKSSSGDFNLLLNTDSIRFTLHTGNTNLYLNGQTNKAYYYSGGTCIIKAEAMRTKNCFANNSGSGDFYINSNDYMYANIDGIGNIHYLGYPVKIDKSGNGKGELIKD